MGRDGSRRGQQHWDAPRGWTSPSRVPVLLVTILLLLATSFGLLGLAQVETESLRHSYDASEEANLALVRAFYAAANEILRTGVDGPLDAFVDARFAEHPALGAPSGRMGLKQQLVTQHTVFPGLHVVIDELIASGSDQVTARLHTVGVSTGDYVGLPVPASLTGWGPIELLRIADGRIAERWSSAVTVLSPLWVADSPSGDEGRQIIAIRKLSWEPGAALRVDPNAAVWSLYTEGGSLTIGTDVDPPGGPAHSRVRWKKAAVGRPEEVTPNQPIVLTAADLLLAPPLTTFSMRNDGTVIVTALLVAWWTPTFIGSPALPLPDEGDPGPRAVALGLGTNVFGTYELAPGVTGQVIATELGVAVPSGAHVGLGRMTLAPGQQFAASHDHMALIVAIEVGQLELATGGTGCSATHEVSSDYFPGDPLRLEAGEGALAPMGAANTWRAGNDAPVTLLVLTVMASDRQG